MGTTDLRLYTGVPLTRDNLNFLDNFTNDTEKLNVFEPYKVKQYTVSPIRRTFESVVVDSVIDEVDNVNYMSFQNADGHRYYCYVSTVAYESEGGSKVFFEIDYMTTWINQKILKDCMIEREHVADDTVATHLIEENLNIGDPIVRTEENVSELEDRAIVIDSTEYYDPPAFTTFHGDIVGGIYTGLVHIPWHESNYLGLTFLFEAFADGHSSALITVYYMPEYFCGSFIDGEALAFTEPITLVKTIPKNYVDLDGYVPKNNKLFNYPYNYLQVNNYNGMSKIYKYEFTDLAEMNFNINSDVAPNPTILLTPLSYNGDNANYSESMSVQGYPICSFVSDTYKNWLAQNIVSAPLSVVGSGLALGVGIATLNPIAIASGVIGVATSIGQFYEKSVIPDQARGSNNGSINTALNNVNYRFQRTTIKAQFARSIDDYFTKFGYKVNRLDVPDLKSRPKFNFIKTIDCNIQGSIPSKDLQEIRNIFNNGVTFWHTTDIGNYNVINSP